MRPARLSSGRYRFFQILLAALPISLGLTQPPNCRAQDTPRAWVGAMQLGGLGDDVVGGYLTKGSSDNIYMSGGFTGP